MSRPCLVQSRLVTVSVEWMHVSSPARIQQKRGFKSSGKKVSTENAPICSRELYHYAAKQAGAIPACKDIPRTCLIPPRASPAVGRSWRSAPPGAGPRPSWQRQISLWQWLWGAARLPAAVSGWHQSCCLHSGEKPRISIKNNTLLGLYHRSAHSKNRYWALKCVQDAVLAIQLMKRWISHTSTATGATIILKKWDLCTNDHNKIQCMVSVMRKVPSSDISGWSNQKRLPRDDILFLKDGQDFDFWVLGTYILGKGNENSKALDTERWRVFAEKCKQYITWSKEELNKRVLWMDVWANSMKKG